MATPRTKEETANTTMSRLERNLVIQPRFTGFAITCLHHTCITDLKVFP